MEKHYVQKNIDSAQKQLIYHLNRNRDLLNPAVVASQIDWVLLKQYKQLCISSEVHPFISDFSVFSYVASCVAAQYEILKTVIIDKNSVRTYESLNLGVAITNTQGNLSLFPIEHTNQTTFDQFLEEYLKGLEEKQKLRVGKEQDNTSFIISYTGILGATFSIPILVYPATAILFVGAPLLSSKHKQDNQNIVNLVLSFNHNLMNGIEAIHFLKAIEIFMRDAISTHTQSTSCLVSTAMETASQIAQIIKIHHGITIDDFDKSLADLGMDSLESVKLSKALAAHFNVKLHESFVWKYPSINKIVVYIENILFSKTDKCINPNVDDLPYEEVIRQLEQKIVQNLE